MMTKKDLKNLMYFVVQLTLAMSLVLLCHLAIIHQKDLLVELPQNIYFLSYAVNAGAAFIIVAILYSLKKIFVDQIGFLFIAGGFLKFALFFVVFQPIYQSDQMISKTEFMSFFIPYITSLILETLAVIKLLKSIDEMIAKNSKKNS
ncbi:MAG: hypothetical protein HRT68_11760 [Flavobacteriaceae bacterium]|nr:hypothetical protein [Flavobacteriaceae bacterium]